MKIKNILFAAAAAGLISSVNYAAATPVPAPITFTLSASGVNDGSPIFTGTNFGTVQLTQFSGSEVDFTVTLASGYAFANTGTVPRNAFAFNLGAGFAIALTNPLLTSGAPAQGNKPAEAPAPVFAVGAGPDSNQTGGFGKFLNGIQFTSGAADGLSGSYTGPITFKVTRETGVHYADFQTTNEAGYLFTADIGNIVSRNTGNVGSRLNRSTPDGDPISVPEPTTLALLGLGLLGFAAARRRKN